MKLRKYFKSLGPGFITAALVFGPGSLIIASRLGAQFEYDLLWIVILSGFFMVIFTLLSSQIGLSIKESLLTFIRSRFGKLVAFLLGLSMFLVTASFQTGNAIGAGLSMGELTASPPSYWIVGISIIAIALLFIRSFYKVLEKIMIALVAVMLFSFLITIIIARPDWSVVFSSLVPSIPSGSGMISIALIASSFSVTGAFYQSYLVKEKKWTESDRETCFTENISAITLLTFVTILIVICAGTVLYNKDINVRSAADLGLVMEPLFGVFTSKIYMIGLFAASFSSMLGNATIGGTLLADALNLGSSLKSGIVRAFIVLIILTGTSIALIFGKFPIELIIFAQGLTITVSPFIGWAIWNTSRKNVKHHRYRKSFNVIAATGLIFLVFLMISYFILLLN